MAHDDAETEEPEEEDDIAARLERLRAALAEATARSGRPPGSAELLAVSKTFPPEAVAEAARAGQRLFGESRVQECLTKIPLLPGRLEWHFIGHLQSNKVRKILPLCPVIHSVDSLELALDIERVAEETGAQPEVYLQVNVAADGRKFGFTPVSVAAAMEQLLALRRVRLTGLMTIPPLVANPEKTRPHFAALRVLRDRLQDTHGADLPGLSMGMSGDFTVAAEEGATIVRVGGALFGKR